ncbi:probable folate-biopterin transporter 6 [Chenopodium quinoa]|uniref:probable folate-biopterin transporter 6 n=1 Tax=Chenopodium quinoa TaxID=63459 RepID=UPI000B785B09|nr:probable folate-biopterin transporter 6 [Chenopodium quinoa]
MLLSHTTQSHKVAQKLNLLKFRNFQSQHLSLSSLLPCLPSLFPISGAPLAMSSNETEELITPHPPSPSPLPSKPKHHPRNPTSLLLQPFQWLKMLSTTLHPTFILGIILVYGLNLGFSDSYFRVVTDYYWKDVQKINPSSAQFYIGFYFIPWILRPLWGLLTDVLPIMGYRRRPYFVIAGVVGVSSAVLVTIATKLPASLALLCFIGVHGGMAMATATIDACTAKNSIEVKELAADLQSLCGFCHSLGALLGYSTSGFLVHKLGAQGSLGILTIAPTAFLLLGFLIYELRFANSTSQGSKKVVERIGGAMEDMYRTIKFPQVWKPSLFMFLSLALSYSTHEGHFYWYTDPVAGPGFSKEFVGMMYAIGAVGSMIGVFIYHKFLKDFSLRDLLFYAQLLYVASGMLDLMFILRWNLPLGIPDPVFIIVEETIYHVIGRIRWMPMVVLSTRLCPLGIEGTFFALLMCIDSVGSLSSKMLGGMVLHYLDISRTNFSNLWLAILVRNCLRFGTIALIFLVPNATQHDVLVPSNITSNRNTSTRVQEATLELVPLSEKLDI